jgi:preprotein translocase subunit SecG
MYGFFLTILVLDGIFLAVVILLQAGKGGGLAAMGGGGGTMTEGVLGGRQASTFLVRASWVAGGIFMVLSLILAILSSRGDRPGSLLQSEFQGAPAVPAPLLPGADAPAGEAGEPATVIPPAGGGDEPDTP